MLAKKYIIKAGWEKQPNDDSPRKLAKKLLTLNRNLIAKLETRDKSINHFLRLIGKFAKSLSLYSNELLHQLNQPQRGAGAKRGKSYATIS